MSIIPEVISSPFMTTFPWVLGIKEVKILKVVDFPAPILHNKFNIKMFIKKKKLPLGPKSPKIYPLSTEKLVFFIAKNPFPYLLYRFYTFTVSLQLISRILFSSATILALLF